MAEQEMTDCADSRDLLDAYDYIRANNLTTQAVKEMARLFPTDFVRVAKVLQDEVVAKRLMGVEGKVPINWDDVDRCIVAGRMIDAIKRVRELSGLGLAEAKTMAEHRREDLAKGSW